MGYLDVISAVERQEKMAKLDDTIYIGQPGPIAPDCDWSDFSQALSEAALGATEITILGGYYNVDALVKLCLCVRPEQRPKCRIRIAVGLEAMPLLVRTWSDMQSVRNRLEKKRFCDPMVCVVKNSPANFHTKLFHFLRTTHHVWFIGSANPGSERHELMVRISGRHEGLSAYVDAVFENALSVKNPPPPPEIRMLRDFFLTGVLCHKPPEQRLFTFDAFQFKPEHRKQFATALAGSAEVAHASPKTEGFGFDLVSALGYREVLGENETAKDSARRIQYRPYGLDSIFGLWIPEAYAVKIKPVIEIEKKNRLEHLNKFAETLSTKIGQTISQNEFKKYFDSMTDFLQKYKIEVEPIRDVNEKFEKFLRSRTKFLNDEETLERYSRVRILTPMPDIWEDQRAAEEFEKSFFEKLNYHVNRSQGNTSVIVKSLLAMIRNYDIDTADKMRNALKERLREAEFHNDNWL